MVEIGKYAVRLHMNEGKVLESWIGAPNVGNVGGSRRSLVGYAYPAVKETEGRT